MDEKIRRAISLLKSHCKQRGATFLVATTDNKDHVSYEDSGDAELKFFLLSFVLSRFLIRTPPEMRDEMLDITIQGAKEIVKEEEAKNENHST